MLGLSAGAVQGALSNFLASKKEGRSAFLAQEPFIYTVGLLFRSNFSFKGNVRYVHC